MKRSTKFDEEICRQNLLLTISEMGLADKDVKYKIIPDIDPKRPSYGEDSVFELVVIPRSDVDGKLFTIEQVSRLFCFIRDKGPTQVKVRLSEDTETGAIVELHTSVRVRKPSQMANIDTGHPPFRIIV